MEQSAAHINAERLRSSSQEMKATFNWELSSRDVFSDPAGSPKLSPPFATIPESVWPTAEALNLRTADIPGAQTSPPKRPHSQVRGNG